MSRGKSGPGVRLLITAVYYLWVIVLDSSTLTLLMDCIGCVDCLLNQWQTEYGLHCPVFWSLFGGEDFFVFLVFFCC